MKRLLLLFIIISAFAAESPLAAEALKLTIIHTNDMHSHLEGMAPNIDYTPKSTGDDSTHGGWARISTLIHEIKNKRKNPVLTLDAGDFMMGTLYHTISREFALEAVLMKKMGYDFLTLGNHEFDLRPRGLAQILSAGKKRGGIPQIISSNLIFSSEESGDDSLEKHFKDGTIKPYEIISRSGVKIGIFGLVGKHAAEVAPFASPVKFDDPIKTARRMVKTLRKEGADIVICLSHSGLYRSGGTSEDETLAEKVKGIDVIISGHSHTLVGKPVVKNGTIIVQSWEYGKRVGLLDITYGKGKVSLSAYRSVVIDDSIKGDPYINAVVDMYKGAVNMKVLKFYQTGYSSKIAHTGFDIKDAERESSLGNLFSDALLWYANSFLLKKDDPDSRVRASFVSGGVIRDGLLAGKTGYITTGDLFRTIPLGIGIDGSPGYPLVAVYLTAADIKKALEVSTSVYPIKGSDYFLQVSGLKYRYNPHRVIFDRVTEILIGNEKEGYKPLDYSRSNKKLYRVTVDYYNASFLKFVGGFTYGILDIVPRYSNGKPVENIKDVRIDADSDREGIQEVKEWIAVLKYVMNFDDINSDGLPDIPERYREKQNRIIREASWNPVSLLKNGSYLTWSFFVALLLMVLITLFTGRFIYRKVRS
jgi:5'-nucleotidase / UDP-sugar diphosphatase